MEGMGGMVLLDNIRARYPTLPVIILTAHGTIPDAVQATEQGAYGFIAKPFDGKALLDLVRKALQLGLTGSCTLGAGDAWRAELISCNPTMEDLINEAKLVAASDVSIAIHGENGTGKEVLAKAIHKASTRAERQFLAINCGAIPEGVLESELFGHKKGAFTGAVRDHKGMFQAAHGGTLLLDEIGDMPTGLQVRLLRVLQEHTFERVGGTTTLTTNARIIAATNRNLPIEVENKQFREDLLYRLKVVHFHLPTLRDRKGDIPLLVGHLLDKIGRGLHKPPLRATEPALEKLLDYDWPGNVRELENVLTRAAALARDDLLTPQLISLESFPVAAPSGGSGDADSHPGGIPADGPLCSLDQLEAEHIQRVLDHSHGHKGHSCEILGISRPALDRKIHKYSLRVNKGA